MGIFGVLQYAVGIPTAVRHVPRVCGYEECVYCAEWSCGEEFGSEAEGEEQVGARGSLPKYAGKIYKELPVIPSSFLHIYIGGVCIAYHSI